MAQTVALRSYYHLKVFPGVFMLTENTGEHVLKGSPRVALPLPFGKKNSEEEDKSSCEHPELYCILSQPMMEQFTEKKGKCSHYLLSHVPMES